MMLLYFVTGVLLGASLAMLVMLGLVLWMSEKGMLSDQGRRD